MKKSFITLFFLIKISTYSFSQTYNYDSKKLLCGPMLSYIDNYHTQMWMLVSSDCKKIRLELENFDEEITKIINYDITNPNILNNSKWYDFSISKYNYGNEIPITINLDELIPDTEYHVDLFIDNNLIVDDMEIYTPRNYLNDIHFILGHDLDINDDNDNGDKILEVMIEKKSDFMVWLGNNVNITSNNNSFKEVIEKYKYIRKRPLVNQFMKSLPHIAIWDYKDYGINTSDNRQSFKDSSLLAFNLFWPNAPKKTYNYTYNDYGVYKKYDYQDVELFLLDNRFFKSSIELKNPKLLGEKQLARFLDEIMSSGATFKFIVCGNSFLTEGSKNNGFKNYENEFNEFIERLHLSRINGVIIITSDTKKASVTKLLRDNAYPLYQFSFNGLSNDGNNIGEFARIKIEGGYNKRTLKYEVFDHNNNIVINKNIHESEIKY